jgi:hypothetical protein
MLLPRMARGRRLTRVRLTDFSRQLKTLIDKAQRLRDEINRSIIATAPTVPSDNAPARRRRATRVRR